jgi:hypothetical protein
MESAYERNPAVRLGLHLLVPQIKLMPIRVVEQNLETALIMEDDADWDIRLKAQMHDFARGVHLLSQPLASSTSRYADPTYPNPKDDSEPKNIFLDQGTDTVEPKHSPYGDNWDLLWLGHCGTRFPEKERDSSLPRGRAVLLGDRTVPETQHLALQYGTDELIKNYPNHTRVIHHTAENVCILAYAITQKAARQILYEFGLKEMNGPFDIELRQYCDGLDRRVHGCYTAQPQYFQHHRAVGSKTAYSDINEESKDAYNDKAYTYNIRWSTRTNLGRLVDGETQFIDGWPDDAPGTEKTY